MRLGFHSRGLGRKWGRRGEERKKREGGREGKKERKEGGEQILVIVVCSVHDMLHSRLPNMSACSHLASTRVW